MLIADLTLGPGNEPPLSCFEKVTCVRETSRSTLKIVESWRQHHLAWFETARMQLIRPHLVGG